MVNRGFCSSAGLHRNSFVRVCTLTSSDLALVGETEVPSMQSSSSSSETERNNSKWMHKSGKQSKLEGLTFFEPEDCGTKVGSRVEICLSPWLQAWKNDLVGKLFAIIVEKLAEDGVFAHLRKQKARIVFVGNNI